MPRDQVAMHIAYRTGYQWDTPKRAHLRTLFHISGTAGRTAPKFGEWLETPQLYFINVKGAVYLRVRMCMVNGQKVKIKKSNNKKSNVH